MSARCSHFDEPKLAGACYWCIKLAARLSQPQSTYAASVLEPILPEGEPDEEQLRYVGVIEPEPKPSWLDVLEEARGWDALDRVPSSWAWGQKL